MILANVQQQAVHKMLQYLAGGEVEMAITPLSIHFFSYIVSIFMKSTVLREIAYNLNFNRMHMVFGKHKLKSVTFSKIRTILRSFSAMAIISTL